MMKKRDITVIGGGLAGCEAAWQLAQRGLAVRLYEMRPVVTTGAHTSGDLAELVCSNSLGSRLDDRAGGVLKNELHLFGSILIKIAEQTAVPAGGALAVDRQAFAKEVTRAIENHPNITVLREEITEISSGPTVIATGPLTSPALAKSIQELTGAEHLYFYDAIAPIVQAESVDMNIAYKASRYEKGLLSEGDYINCPITQADYMRFIDALVTAERVELHEFESQLGEGVRAGLDQYFEGCLPIEVLAMRGREALAYGPLRPMGLDDPRTGRHPYAVLQLRQDNLAASLYNLVGFQTNLKYAEQKRVFRMIPGLRNAEFVRYGQMHRNTFIFSPAYLRQTLQFYNRDDLFFAGQITGVEGYVGNIATGLLAGINAWCYLSGKELITLPQTTMLGSLCYYITHASSKDFQPMKANFGILPALEDDPPIRGKRERARAFAHRALSDLEPALAQLY